MKVLAVHGIGWDKKKLHKEKAVDLWRIKRPIDELKKHVDWQIDELPTFIPGIEKYKDSDEFTASELENAAEKLGKYDIIWSTYFTNPSFYALLRAVNARYGTKFVMDVDDDLFSIKEDNPIWAKLTHENVYHMQCMVRDADYITTTTEEFAQTLRSKRPDKSATTVMVVPNMIPDSYKHDSIDNGDKTVIGYFGGSSHINDLENTCAIEAVEKLMNENKSVEFVACGIPITKYLPRKRYTYLEGMPSTDFVDKVFPTLNFDIAIAPLEESIFALGKSNIKWQEATRMGSAFIASGFGPYATLPEGTCVLVNNNIEEWYEGLKLLVEDVELRKKIVTKAQKELDNYRLEKNWQVIQKMFEKVGRKKPVLLTL